MTSNPAVHPVAFTEIESFSALFKAYCADYDALSSFYAGDYRSREARLAAADRAAAHPRDRETLVEVLLEQNARWGMDERTRAAILSLRDPASVAVVTGQQVGLLTGPLYTPYKTLTALQLARQLQEETGRPVVPIFWLEGEDHDLEEIASTTLMQGNTTVKVRYDGHALPETGNLGPVGRLVLNEQINTVLDQVDAVLPPTDFKAALMANVRAAYQPGTTLCDAFSRLMRSLFPDVGLVFISPDNARLKKLSAPLFRREVEDFGTGSAVLAAVSEKLEAQFHAQVRPRSTNLFMLEADGRYALDAEDGAFRLRSTDRVFSQEEVLKLLDTQPERFSPNVVLRPLMQDTLLPTAAYIAGPGEVAYFAQFKPMYAWSGLPMPVIYPRASITLIESKVKKVLDRYQLSLTDFETDPEALFRRLVLDEMDTDLEAAFKQAARHLHTAVNELKPLIEGVDRSLIRTAEATRAALMKEFERLKGRVVKAEKRRHDDVRDRLDKASANLFPEGKLQERALSSLYFLNKYSPELLKKLLLELSLDTGKHQVLDV